MYAAHFLKLIKLFQDFFFLTPPPPPARQCLVFNTIKNIKSTGILHCYRHESTLDDNVEKEIVQGTPSDFLMEKRCHHFLL